MTSIASSSSPLLARAGPGVGVGAPAPAATPASGVQLASLAPTPNPSLQAGRGEDRSRLSSSGNLKVAGQKFEAVFTGMMLKSMRQAKLADPLFDSKAIDTFSEMQDARVAQAMAEHQPLGIGRAMTDFLARSQADLQTPDTGTPSP